MHKIVTMNDFKNIPSIDRILKEPSIKTLLECYTHDSVVKLVQHHIQIVRQGVKAGKQTPSFKKLIKDIQLSIAERWVIQPSPVINASGVILHTNLGRAPLSDQSKTALSNTAGGYTDLEYDTVNGFRSNRQKHVQSLINHITGSEAALVVNNNAAADLSLLVKGMTCNHCKETVHEAISSCVNENDRIEINLESGQTFIYGNNLNKQHIITSINNVGYSIGEIA